MLLKFLQLFAQFPGFCIGHFFLILFGKCHFVETSCCYLFPLTCVIVAHVDDHRFSHARFVQPFISFVFVKVDFQLFLPQYFREKRNLLLQLKLRMLTSHGLLGSCLYFMFLMFLLFFQTIYLILYVVELLIVQHIRILGVILHSPAVR